jgi:hypothetical protein
VESDRAEATNLLAYFPDVIEWQLNGRTPLALLII